MKAIQHLTIISITLIATIMNSQELNLKIFRAEADSFHVASVIIEGEKEAVLIDAQFTLANAYRVLANLKEGGKSLKTIYISHGDPDYYFGLEVITQAFPDAIVYATEQTVKHIKHTYQKKLSVWGPKLGSNGTKNVTIPRIIEGSSIELEGKKIEIRGLEGKSAKRSYLWIPSLKAIVGGVNVYNNLHLWIADAGSTQERNDWINILTEMEKLQPKTVIPAHALTDENNTIEAITFSKKYLQAYQATDAKTKNSEELIDSMKALYPNAQLDIALQLGAKVAKGEMKW
ncbi:hypothetical protein A8C32_08255 [Flavivirga aquatica]|uniref:Metallo-beta-lactamase domain-containing protein n=1 Tax=Flavivirga aquatica TaxID=1849968 RepID=A0A1E5SJB7_9FLAO|nr:MBL fold metallo-hydrolase [Flavivirga aquatica]OEJ99156.1 hypothetical protein A8C32_08255 [Flavivirga aquatica]